MEKKIKLNTPVNTNAMQLVVILQNFGCYVKNKINESVCDELDEMDMRSLHDKIVKVLDEDKVRNCDVGTVDEQYKRHENYCGNGSSNISCINSTASNCRKCYAKWLQMEYQ